MNTAPELKKRNMIKLPAVLFAWVLLLLVATAYMTKDSGRVELLRGYGNGAMVSLNTDDVLYDSFYLHQDFQGVRVRTAPDTGAQSLEMILYNTENGETSFSGTASLMQESSGDVYYVLDVGQDAGRVPLTGGSYILALQNTSAEPASVMQENGLSVYCYSNIPRLLFLVVFALLTGGIVLLYYLRAWWCDRPERFSLISLATIGICFILLIPGWCTADFYGHWPSVLHHANRLTGLAKEYDYYLTVRQDDLFYLEEVMLTIDEMYATAPMPGKRFYLDVWKYAFEPCHDSTVIVSERAAPAPMRLAFYSAWNYLPYSLVCIVCRWLNMGLMGVLLCCRFFAFAFFTLCICHAVKRMPLWYGKWAIVFVSLIPVSVKTLTAITYDAMVYVVTVNLISTVCAFCWKKQDVPWSRGRIAELMVWCFLTGAVKGGGYAVFALFVLTLLRKPVRDKRNGIAVFALVLCVLTIVYYDVIRFQSDEGFFQLESLEGSWSVSYAMEHADTFLAALLATVLEGAGDVLHSGIQGVSWHENITPWWFSVLYFGCTILAVRALSDRHSRQHPEATYDICSLLQKKDSLILFAVLLFMVISIPVSLLRDVPIHSKTLSLGHGRYYLPLLLPAFLIYGRQHCLRMREGEVPAHVETSGDSHAEAFSHTVITGFIMLWYLLLYFMACRYLTRS